MSENKGQLLRDALERFEKMRIDEATLEKACSQCVPWQRTRMLEQKEYELKQRVQELERNSNMLTNLMYIEDRSGTHRKSALQLDVKVLERRVVELERRLSEMAIEVVALTEENRVLKLIWERE